MQLDEFYKDKYKRDGRMTRCKECEKRLQREKYEKNKGTPGYDPKLEKIWREYTKMTKEIIDG